MDYRFRLRLEEATPFVATLVWFMDRDVLGYDPTAADPFAGSTLVDNSFDNLDLELWSTDAQGDPVGLVAESISSVDSVEHIRFDVPQIGYYLLRVKWTGEIFDNVGDINEARYGIAWSSTFALLDCNANGIDDSDDISAGTSQDCNANTIPDECDIADGTSEDCNGNGNPDECEPDCNANGVADNCDISSGTSQDCNANTTPDECDVQQCFSSDCQPNAIPDECEVDCQPNGIPDDCEILKGASLDCQVNGMPDECDISSGDSLDAKDPRKNNLFIWHGCHSERSEESRGNCRGDPSLRSG